MRLQGKTALIAGASRNIGKATALTFAREGADLILVARQMSLTSQPIRAHVVASKTGLYGLIKSLALELGPFGIRANLIAVGFIGTERRNPEWYPEENNMPFSRSEVESTPLRRTGTPQEVANVALFLASDESSYITGDRIVCAGGRYM